MDKSFTSLTYKKGPSRRACSEFISKFKSVILSNSQIGQDKMESERNKMRASQIENGGNTSNLDETENEEHDVSQSHINKGNGNVMLGNGNEELEAEDLENSLQRQQDKRDRVKPKVNAYRITIGNDYVIRINQRSARSATRRNDLEEKEQEPVSGKTTPDKTEINVTRTFSLTSSTANVFKRKENHTQWQLNQSDDAKLEKLDTDPTAKSANTLDPTEATRVIDNDENGTERDSRSSQNLTIVDQGTQRSGNDCDTVQTNVEVIEESNPIQRERERKVLSQESSDEVCVQGESTVEVNQQKILIQQSGRERTMTAESFRQNSTVHNGPSVETTRNSSAKVTFQEESADEKPHETSSSCLENPESSTANLSGIKQELDAWLQVDPLTRVSSDSLCKVLSQVLEEISSVNIADLPDSSGSDSCDARDIVIKSNKYYIVNIEQIKSMAEILDRISKVILALMKYAGPDGEATSDSQDFCTCNGNAESGQEAPGKTVSRNSDTQTGFAMANHSHDRDTTEWIVNHADMKHDPAFGILGANRSTTKAFGYSTDDFDPESVHTSSVSVQDSRGDSLPSSDNAFSSFSSQPESVQTDSILLEYCLFDSSPSFAKATSTGGASQNRNSFSRTAPVLCYASLASQTSVTDLPSETVGSQGELCPNEFHSLGSQTSDSDVDRLVRQRELNEGRDSCQERERQSRERKLNRQRSRFRSSAKRNSSDSVQTTDELLALLDSVEKLLMNNCADRYEMMLLLEQIFDDYAMSAQKAVADLRKFIVTFNKNNSYL